MLLGVFAALVAILVQSIVVTYFIGTGRWCKEVVETYGLSADFVNRAARLKRRAFPWSLLGMMALLCIVTFGAAADPATLRANTAAWVRPHLIVAMGGTAFVAACLYMQANSLQANVDLINEILGEVRVERERRGLAIDEETMVAK